MLDSRQRDELNELIKYFSTRVAWFRLGLFITSLIQFATNGENSAVFIVLDNLQYRRDLPHINAFSTTARPVHGADLPDL